MNKLAPIVAAAAVAMSASAASALSVTGFDPATDPTGVVTNALLASGSGINIVSGSESYVGAAGQGGTFSGLSLTSASGNPTLGMSSGILLTSGTAAALPQTNTASNFTVETGSGSDADLSALVGGGNVNDVNFLSFSFTVDSGNAVTADFIFGSDEFPDQSVTDVFGIFVDGVNYAFFEDGSLVSFVTGENASQFVANNDYAIEYDGLSRRLTFTGLLDADLTEHTIKIAIGDTSDNAFDSGVFVSGLQAITTASETGGVTPGVGAAVPIPASLPLLGAAVAGFAAFRRRRGA
mgnify:CR=1 FL=1